VSFNKNERARAVALKVEAEAVRDATLVIAVTEAARKELSGRYPNQDDSKFRCIPNGFETRRVATPPLSQLRTGGDPVAFTYIGSVYGSTDPSTFVEAVLALPKTARDRLRVRFIGHIETSAYRLSLERLGGTIELKGFLPQAEALKALDETDFLLLITHDNINVSAKFYDYLSVSKPIFAAVDPAGEVRRLLDETQAGLWADINDPEAITNMLVRLLTVHDGQPKYNPKREIIAAYDRSVLAKRYAELLRTLA
jgi:hypothetical protein